MKILLLNQYYPPDTAPTGQYLHDLAKALVARGHEVRVLCSRRAYNGAESFAGEETIDGVQVRRIRAFGFGRKTAIGKLLDYVTFYFSLAMRLGRRDENLALILALTTPPYVGMLARWAARRQKVPHAHWVMDIYPDVLAAHGALDGGGLLYRILGRLTRRELSDSALTSTLGEDMADRLRHHLSDQPTALSALRPLPLWVSTDLKPWPLGEIPPFRKERGWGADELVLMYSGNMGRGHRFGEFLAGAAALKGDRTVRWVFAGGGARRNEVEAAREREPGMNLELLSYAPSEKLREHLCSADVHLVSLDSSWQGCMVPSKVQGIFAIGKPLIFVGGADNSIAQWIREANCGWIVPQDDVNALLAAVNEARSSAERARRGMAARVFAEKHFDRQQNLDKLCVWVEGCCVIR